MVFEKSVIGIERFIYVGGFDQKVGNFEKAGGFYRKVVAFGEKWGYL
jgi:hypothetical protein